MELFLNIILPLILTIIIEGAVLWILEGKFTNLIIWSIPINTFTNLTLNLTLTGEVSPDLYFILLIIAEILIIVIEAILYYLIIKKLKFKKAIIYSTVTNFLSFGIGLLITYIFSII